ncbi:MAG: hypothetical protein A3J07_00945 [Candidatus Doudnabacteria bacterium RIFCSPLOWO2_02_FULL_49_13]|uniref:HNH nuclease domain-containing protein n=1 Tax=Candidatus Doudnabacteria bacterium RIFCSPHIGHO2_12_FULL_48_16 TaxID=1817838 RepID=A0A1F5PK71_9BACT|nr:MAG: hypothetical protein A3B77_04510 [Candidatus Doudnabacteria bacterium RIFCSPHIGHO2_02_FULL_49_24]OGE89915.1 MAG: hypothetical protein A2760_04405 [Candidatus Doudnabacteria bacterium RIFCSPHIGHO2_01_FULL_50_67]OGE90316.1 MAG: hypothetical protein A3E29_04455 [Candidatus Doudnabacteria bacterium RIFCSPHIGHO2_12_FULL_48_16]OGE96744.1 MAG: hypothetical protein A2990_00445 [Candidatus Doudnabacteria bacterium RIFCSPLOWO2_01_FULL_49_40]OGF02372.1 MAG: hypothetical protein A3J07_00945 [Candid
MSKDRKKKWTGDQLKKAAQESFSIRQVIFKLGLIPAGGNYVQIQNYLRSLHIDTSHFKGKSWNKGLTGLVRASMPIEQILVKESYYQSYKLKKRLFSLGLKARKCEECGWAKTTPEGRLPLELDHINGNRNDNRLENLRVLCPNCHSLQPTHRARNKKKK